MRYAAFCRQNSHLGKSGRCMIQYGAHLDEDQESSAIMLLFREICLFVAEISAAKCRSRKKSCWKRDLSQSWWNTCFRILSLGSPGGMITDGAGYQSWSIGQSVNLHRHALGRDDEQFVQSFLMVLCAIP